MTNRLREAAIEYTERGWFVFPLLPKSKQPNGLLVPQGYKEASNWGPDCLYWWAREPDGNIGLACRQSGLVVVDIDFRANGFQTMQAWINKYGTPDPFTMGQNTPTLGAHLIFQSPKVQLKGQLGPGVDIKDQGYILLDPSEHPEGGQYKLGLENLPPAKMPEAWIEALKVDQFFAERAQNFTLRKSDAPLLQVPAEIYAEALTGREVRGDWMQCPFHKDGNERTPSFKVDGSMWACFGCEPMLGKQVMGGNIIDLAAMLKGYALPVRGADLMIVKDELEAIFCKP